MPQRKGCLWLVCRHGRTSPEVFDEYTPWQRITRSFRWQFKLCVTSHQPKTAQTRDIQGISRVDSILNGKWKLSQREPRILYSYIQLSAHLTSIFHIYTYALSSCKAKENSGETPTGTNKVYSEISDKVHLDWTSFVTLNPYYLVNPASKLMKVILFMGEKHFIAHVINPLLISLNLDVSFIPSGPTEQRAQRRESGQMFEFKVLVFYKIHRRNWIHSWSILDRIWDLTIDRIPSNCVECLNKFCLKSHLPQQQQNNLA